MLTEAEGESHVLVEDQHSHGVSLLDRFGFGPSGADTEQRSLYSSYRSSILSIRRGILQGQVDTALENAPQSLHNLPISPRASRRLACRSSSTAPFVDRPATSLHLLIVSKIRRRHK